MSRSCFALLACPSLAGAHTHRHHHRSALLSTLASAVLLCLHGPLQAQNSTPAATPAADPAPQTVVITPSADASAGGLSKPYPGGQVARGGRVGVLGTQDVMDTPFSVTSYTQALLQDQQARSVADALLNDPAVRNARGFGNFQEVYVLRGLPVYSDDMAYNGLYGLLPRQYVATELLERVEVFRGASAFVNGAAPGGSGLGGAINLVPKRAGNSPLTQATFGLETGGQALLGLDVARRFGADRATGVRVNAVSRQGNTAITGESRQLGLLAVGLDWHGGNARLSADLGWQAQRQDAPRPSVTPLGAIPVAPAANSNFAQPWTYAVERQLFGTLRGEFDLARDTLLWVAAGARQGSEDNRLANPSAAANGQGTAYRFDNSREDRVVTGELGLRSVLHTGSVSHTLSASAARFSVDSRNAYAFSNFAGFASNLFSPQAVAAPAASFFTGGVLNAPLTTQKTSTSSLALADVISLLDDRLRLTLGARQQRIEDRTFDYNTGAPAGDTYSQSRVTPMLGVLLKVSPAVSVYANAIDGLVKGDVAPAVSGVLPVSNKNQVFAPYQTHQVEAGAKFDLGRLGGAVSVFELRKPVGTVVDNGNNTATFVVRDDQRHRGLELSVYGEAARGLKLLGGLNLIDADLSSSGKQAIGVPRQQLNLGAEWSPAGLPDLAFNTRLLYTGSQWADSANTLAVPAWTRLDIGVRWSTELLQRPLTLRARLDNTTNKAYWASAGGYPGANYLVLGAPRTMSVSATMDF